MFRTTLPVLLGGLLALRSQAAAGLLSTPPAGDASAETVVADAGVLPQASHFDIIVVGTGSGASKLGTPASKLGFRVAVVEHGFDVFPRGFPGAAGASSASATSQGPYHHPGLGGTCLLRGCIPSKMLIHPADVATELKHEAGRLFLDAEFRGVDYEKLVDSTTRSVDSDSDSILSAYDYVVDYSYDKASAGSARAASEEDPNPFFGFLDLDAAGGGDHVVSTTTPSSALVPGGRDGRPRITSKTPHPDESFRHLYRGTAEFVGDRTIRVGGAGQNASTISADYVFLATGAEPAVPPIPGLAETPFLTSTEALRLKKLPTKIIVIGAGYIAVELGHMFGALGSEVHVMGRSELLRTMDSEAREEFARVFEKRYNVHERCEFLDVAYDAAKGEFALTYRSGANGAEQVIAGADQLLIVTGVTPSSAQLNPAAGGIQVRQGGFVQVDDRLRTSAPNVWAFGDVAGKYLFRHCANFEGEYLMEKVIYPLALSKGLVKIENLGLANANEVEKWGAEYAPIEYVMPWAVFSNPQVAGVGKSEDDLINSGGEQGVCYVTGVNSYKLFGMGDGWWLDHGFVKLFVDVQMCKVLGCVIVGYEASTMIHQVMPVIAKDGVLEDLLYPIYVHPALSEILKNACRKARDALVAGGFPVPLKLRLK